MYLCKNTISMIARKIYLNQLISLCNQNIIKVITGIRRCGKSTLLSEFKDYLKAKGVEENNILLLNFEEREYSDFERCKQCKYLCKI